MCSLYVYSCIDVRVVLALSFIGLVFIILYKDMCCNNGNCNNFGNLFNRLDQNDIEELIQNGVNCSICLNDYTNQDVVVRLRCGHCFHENCIEGWLKEKRICPMCRAEVR